MATSLATIFLMVGGVIAGRFSARISPFALLPAGALLLAASSLGPDSLSRAEIDLPIRQPHGVPIALLILLAISICVAALRSQRHKNTSLIAAGAVASTSALVAQNDIMLAAGIGSSILLCVRNAWAGSDWQEDRAVSNRVAVTSVLAMLFLISAPILIQTQSPKLHAHMISSAIGLLIVSVTMLSAAFPFGGLAPALADPGSRYRWSVSLGCAQLMALFLIFSIFEGGFEIVELDYWSTAIGVLMVILSLTAIGSWASSDRYAAMECGRYAITALAIAVIMAGGWFSWLGLFVGGAALIVAAVSIQARHFETRAASGTLDKITHRIVLLTTIGFPGSLVSFSGGWQFRWPCPRTSRSPIDGRGRLASGCFSCSDVRTPEAHRVVSRRLEARHRGFAEMVGAVSCDSEPGAGNLPSPVIRNHHRMEFVDRHLPLIVQSWRRTVTSSPRFNPRSLAALPQYTAISNKPELPTRRRGSGACS